VIYRIANASNTIPFPRR